MHMYLPFLECSSTLSSSSRAYFPSLCSAKERDGVEFPLSYLITVSLQEDAKCPGNIHNIQN